VGGAEPGRAAAAAVRAQASERGPDAAGPSPEEKQPHEKREAEDQDSRLVGQDAEQIEAERARTLLELAGVYTRQALRFPDEIEHLRTIVAELLFENGILRLRVEEMESRLDRLERRSAR
jgi:hypothetical protein